MAQMQSILGSLLFQAPDPPPAPNVDFTAQIQKSIQDALANIPGVQQLASKYNAFTADELTKTRERLTPGINALTDKTTAYINNMLEGNLPQGVQEALHRDILERGQGLGISGSTFEKFSDISESSKARLAYSQAGLSAAERWVEMSRATTPLFDIGRYMPTPGQYAQVEQWNEENRYGRDWLAKQIKWAGSWQHAVQGLLDWVATTGSEVVESYAGMAGGGMGGGGGGAMMNMGGGGGGGGGYQGQDMTLNQINQGASRLGGY